MKEHLKGFAPHLGLDTAAFNECLDSGKYAQVVQSETTAGQQLGVQSTPTFLVNSQLVVGAEPFNANSLSKALASAVGVVSSNCCGVPPLLMLF